MNHDVTISWHDSTGNGKGTLRSTIKQLAGIAGDGKGTLLPTIIPLAGISDVGTVTP